MCDKIGDDSFKELTATEPDITLGKMAMIMRTFQIGYAEFSMHRELYNTFFDMLRLLGGNAEAKCAFFTLLNRHKKQFAELGMYRQIYALIQKGELARAKVLIERVIKGNC